MATSFTSSPSRCMDCVMNSKESSRVARRSRPLKKGYFQIVGTLTRHLADEEGKVTSHSREVTFKSMPFDAPEETGHEPAKSISDHAVRSSVPPA